MHISRSLPFAALMILGLAVPVLGAQDFKGRDRNGDRVISRNEWTGDTQSFNRHDWDGNGVIDGDEVPVDLRGNNTRARAAENGPQESQRSRNRTVNRLDENNSGVVEGYEWPYNADIFRQLDTNRDNVLETNELAHINSTVMVELDRNHNSKIDANEWPGGFAEFENLDQNGDGKVSSQEYFERGGEWQRRSRFDHWDTDQDSAISSSEWKSSATLFHKLDKNGDSKIDWSEFKPDEGRYFARPYGSRY